MTNFVKNNLKYVRVFMKILKLCFIVAAFSTISCVQAADKTLDNDRPLIKNSLHLTQTTQPNDMLELVLQRLDAQEKKLKTQDEINKIKQQEIETLQKIVAAMDNPNKSYRKLLSPDLGLWLTLCVAGGMGYAKYNEGFFVALVVFYTTFCSIYWGFKETRNWITTKTIPKN